MHFTSFYIEKLKISNFLSFFGVQEVSMERFTAIACNYSEGRRDLLRALEFVLGATPKQILAYSTKHLVHKVFWKEFEKENAVSCSVEFSLNLMSEKSMKFYRGVKNSGIEHKIDDKLVSNFHYEEMLNKFNIFINHKNLIFSKYLFYGVIWGNSEDLEKTVAEILRATSSLDEWTKTKKKIKYLQEAKKHEANKNYRSMKKSHETIEKFVDTFNDFVKKTDCFKKSSNMDPILEEDSLLSVSSDNKSSKTPDETVFKVLLHDISLLEPEQELLFERYRSLEIKEKLLLCTLFFNELKISSKPANANILQERIMKLKAKLKELENYLPTLWTKMKEIDNLLEDLGCKISNDLGNLWELQQSFHLTNRFTTYGRFIDHLQHNNYMDVLKKILGEEIFYGHLCDDIQTAIFYLNSFKVMKYSKRETFLILENYSAKLKDLLISSEGGIRINNIQELQIFLCKLKQYGLILEVPIIVRRRFNFKLEEGKNYDDGIIYILDGVFLKSDGLIIYISDDKTILSTEESVLERLNTLLIEQDMKYEEYRDLIFNRQETLRNILDLEDDILYLKFQLRRSLPSGLIELEKRQMPNVYDPYITFFKEHDQQIEDMERDLEDSDYLHTGQKTLTFLNEGEISQLESSLKSVSRSLEEIEREKMKTKKELLEVEKKLRLASATLIVASTPSITRHPVFHQPTMQTQFYYENQLECLKLLMSKNEVEEFVGWKDWRKEVIQALIRDIGMPDSTFKELKTTLESLTASRKKFLSPVLEHCSLHLSSVLNFMMDISLPFLDLTMNHSEDGLQLLTSFPESSDNIVEIGNLNTFLKLIATLSLFLEIAVYDKIPILLFDDIEEFLPRYGDNLESVLNENVLKRVLVSNGNARYQVLMRLAQFFEYFIKKNNHGNTVRKNENKTGINGPTQYIYFTSGDLVHFAQHQLVLKNKILPDEYLTDDCNSYSSLEEIHFE